MEPENQVNLMESPQDKVVLLGDVGVGKTSLFIRFKSNEFTADCVHNPRDGEFNKRWKTKAGHTVSMTLYDTAGLERHMSTIPQTYFRWSKVIVLVYSIDDASSFDSLTNWADNALSISAARSQSDVVSVLVGNKSDLESERCVSKQRAMQFAANNDVSEDMVFEVSAKEGTGVQEMFDTIACKITPPSLQPSKKDSAKKKPECC